MTMPALPTDYSGPPLHQGPPAPVAPPVAVPPVVAAPVAPPAPVAAPPVEPSAPVVRGRGGDPMDEEAIADRVKRSNKKLLKDTWGTDDEAEIARLKAKRAQDDADLAKLKADREKADRDQMTEVQRLTKDIEALKAENADLKAQIAGKEREVMSSRQEVALSSRLAKHKFIDKPAAQATVKLALKNHFDSLSKTNQQIFVKTGELDKWLATFAKENDYLVQKDPAAVVTTTPPAVRAAPAPRPVTRIPAGGVRPPVPPRANVTNAAPDPLEGKTPLPGRANSMTKTELAEYMKRGRTG